MSDLKLNNVSYKLTYIDSAGNVKDAILGNVNNVSTDYFTIPSSTPTTQSPCIYIINTSKIYTLTFSGTTTVTYYAIGGGGGGGVGYSPYDVSSQTNGGGGGGGGQLLKDTFVSSSLNTSYTL